MKLRPLLIAILLGVVLLVACGEDPKPAKQSAPPKPQSQQVVEQTREPPPQTLASWPFLSEEQSLHALAGDLTARNFVLIFDGSGSMGESDCAGDSRKLEIAKQAVVAWSKSVPEDANLGFYSFNAKGITTLGLTTGNRQVFIDTVMGIRAGGGTPLSQALSYAFKTLTSQGKRQLGYGEYTIVVVTDGIAHSKQRLKSTVNKILGSSPVTIFSIGFCIGDDHSLNQPGRTIYRSADNPDQLKSGLQEVLAELEFFDEQEFTN
ncbi:hypothetical protein D3OALGA1CA_5843 [Olavius algarvensis associated proteobacterium Delta 3]|nr:hypothetical protein D3OALGB2SA_1273 [Olavius algarvensis associated proteobacterium Delta 3]CAB5172560.1 hypothetical protein D3OALGA1CA_5843 [Olavius algarvensis associated proteobacterium Delta 3]